MTKIAIERITAQQTEEGTAVWMVGQQLKDICKREPICAELITQDLENPSMSLEQAEKQIKAWADKHKTRNFACVTPDVADKILREFYGLPTASQSEAHQPVETSTAISASIPAVSLNLADFL